MSVYVLHISDLHIALAKYPSPERFLAVAAAIEPQVRQASLFVIALSGDVTFSGRQEEYNLALRLLGRLRSRIEGMAPRARVEFLVVPGNHDCDFRLDTTPRQLLVKHPMEWICSSDCRDAVLECAKVQAAFSEFSRKLIGETDGSTAVPNVIVRRSLPLETGSILFECYNTALLATLEGSQGNLYVPVNYLRESDLPFPDDVKVTIGMYHHPSSWLESTNAREFREMVESRSHLVLTGHEHVTDSYEKRRPTGGTNYVEAGAFFTESLAESEFYLHHLDPQSLRYTLSRYAWVDDCYVLQNQDESVELSARSAIGAPKLSASFQFRLREMGAGFSHPRKTQLELPDLFQWPDLVLSGLSRKLAGSKPFPILLRDQGAPDYLAKAERVLLIGAGYSGKTALAKSLFREFFDSKAEVPILLEGEVWGVEQSSLSKALRAAVKLQYENLDYDHYLLVPFERRVLIIDDFDALGADKDRQRALLLEAHSIFSRVILTADELLSYEELPDLGAEKSPFEEYERWEIRELGHRLRGRIVTKWQALGQTERLGDLQVAREVVKQERLLNTVIGSQMLPAYPMIVLTILQAAEALKTPSSTVSGSYGYLYEALITASLTRVVKGAAELDSLYSLLSGFAHALFQDGSMYIGRLGVAKLIDRYNHLHQVSYSDREINKLVEARIIQRSDDDTYRFRYPYCYYYFLARYFRDNIGDPSEGASLRAQLTELVDTIYHEDAANTVIFYLYLTREREIIERLVESASRIYKDVEPFDIGVHAEYLNRLYKEAPKAIMPPPTTLENREKHRDDLDEAENSRLTTDMVVHRAERVHYADELEDIKKLTICIRTMEVLGQVLRNFPSSLRGGPKHAITKETYLLGLRALRVVVRISESDTETVRLFLSEIVRRNRPAMNDPEIAKTTDELMIRMNQRSTFGMLKKISHCVGLEMLRATYETVLQELKGNTSVRMVDLSIKCDHFLEVPEKEIDSLRRELRPNLFAFSVLRDLVVDYLYLWPLPESKRQRIAGWLGLDASHPLLRAGDQKRAKGARQGK